MRMPVFQADTRLTSHGNGRLLMVFLGWGMSPEPFLSLSKPGYDVMLLWNYRPAGDDAFGRLRRMIDGYSEIVVVAWSFGVVAASYVLDALSDLPFTRTIAVNGTPRHIDRRMGIPPAVFALTLRGLSPAAVVKFNTRMFSDEKERIWFESYPSTRGFESIRAELNFFGELPPYNSSANRWNFAVVGGKDAIFPPANQSACWEGSGCKVTLFPESGHYIDLQKVIDDFVVDKELVANRFGTAMETYRESAGAQREVARRLWNFAEPFLPGRTDTVVEVGVGDGLLTELYADRLRPKELLLLDIAEVGTSRFPAKSRFVRCDAETEFSQLCPDASVDAVFSSSTLQWFNSPEVFVARAYRALRPGGILAFSFYGDGTYREVAEITGVSLKYPDPSGWKHVGEILLFEKETVEARFADASAAVRHISRTGVNALRRNPSTAVAAGRKLIRDLPKNADGSVGLTYVPYYLIIRKPII